MLKVFSYLLPCKYNKLTKFYSALFCPNQSPRFFSPLKLKSHQLPTVHPRLLLFQVWWQHESFWSLWRISLSGTFCWQVRYFFPSTLWLQNLQFLLKTSSSIPAIKKGWVSWYLNHPRHNPTVFPGACVQQKRIQLSLPIWPAMPCNKQMFLF